MEITKINRSEKKIKLENLKNYLLISLSVFLPISIYLTDLIIIILFAIWILNGRIMKNLKIIMNNPILRSCILFFLYFLLSHFWGGESIFNQTTQKQLLILLLPVLWTLNFDKKYYDLVKYGFILGLLCNVILSFFTVIFPKNLLFKRGHYEDVNFAHGFLDHFDYSIFLCFGLLVILSLINSRNFKYFLIIILIFIITLINSYGRIGIVSFYIFFPICIYLFTKGKTRILTLTSFVFISIICFKVFKPFQSRINQTIENVKLIKSPLTLEEKIELDALYLSQKNSETKEFYIEKILSDKSWVDYIDKKKPEYETSIGKRYSYIKNVYELSKETPLYGFGANQFQKIYSRKFDDSRTKHPHNNYLFVLIELGLAGLFFLLLIFFYQILDFFKTEKKEFLKLTFPLFFIFIMFLDNYFLNHNTLVFFCLFSFIIFSKKS